MAVIGRPSGFKVEYCDMLIEHMKNGGSFESFGALVQCGKQTLYNWLEKHPEFMDAKTKGASQSLLWWENVIKMQATGQLKRLKSEEPKLDKEGKVMYDKKGNVMMRRTYEAATGNPAALIFALKNMHGWRDKRDLNIAGQPDNKTPIVLEAKYAHLTDEEVERRFNELMKHEKKHIDEPHKNRDS